MRAVLLICSLTVLPAVLPAQAPAPHPLERSLGLWAGASLSPSALFGTITDRQLILTGLRLEYVLESAGTVTTTYFVDLHPLAVVTNTPLYGVAEIRPGSRRPMSQTVETGRAPAIGAGLSPLGLQLYTSRLGGARLFAGSSIGGLWFNREMPIAGAHRFNFALQAGGGIELASRTGAVVVGYKFHHLSNAGTAAQNPGLDAHVFYVGLMRRRRVEQVVASEDVRRDDNGGNADRERR
jgi:hypothetical protein